MLYRFLLAILFSLAISCCHCQQDAPKDAVQVIISSSPESLDPRFAGSLVAANVSQLIYTPLFVIGDDLQPKPFIVKHYEQPDDLSYLVTLREDVFFHDGTKLTAHDVVYTISTLASDDVKSSLGGKLNYLDSIAAVSDDKVLFRLKYPFAPFLMDAGTIGIVSKKHCENRSQQCRHEPMGAGPFRFVSKDDAKDVIHLAANEKWFEGAPKIKKLQIRVVRDATTRLLELIKGKADLLNMDLAPIQVEALQKRSSQLTVEQFPGVAYSYLAMNLRADDKDPARRALADPKVRLALAHALPIDEILAAKFEGAAKRATGLLPPGHWAKSSELQPIAYNPARAKELLDEAGFVEQKNKGRFTLTLNVSPDRFRQSLGLIFAHAFEQIGIKVELRVKEWSALYEDIQKGNFEMFSATWLPVVEPDLMYWVFHTDNIPAPGKPGGNRGAYINKSVDSLIEQGRKETDVARRAQIYQTIEKQLLIDMPYIPLWFEDKFAVVNKRLANYKQDRSGSLLGLRHASF